MCQLIHVFSLLPEASLSDVKQVFICNELMRALISFKCASLLFKGSLKANVKQPSAFPGQLPQSCCIHSNRTRAEDGAASCAR